MSYRAECVRGISNWTKVSKEHKFERNSFDPIAFKKDMPLSSPKLVELVKNISELDAADYQKHGRTFKHFIFSDVKQGGVGAKIIASALIAHGLNLAYTKNLKLKTDNELLQSSKKNFILLVSTSIYNGTIGVGFKKSLLSKFNQRPDNVYGDLVRFIVMDSGFKEGIDLFDVKYVHIFEPQTSKADEKQVIGRGTRTCGQKGLVFHPSQGWPLDVFIYDLTLPETLKTNVVDTMFKLYMESKGIDLRLLTLADELEQAAIVGSVDYELNKNIHRFELEDDTQYDIFTGGSKDFDCGAKKCGKVRSTKAVPVSTPLLTIAALVSGVKIPKMPNKGAYPRDFYCGELKRSKSFCATVKDVFLDPVQFVKDHQSELLAAIKKRTYGGLPQSQRSSFLRVIYSILPRPPKKSKIIPTSQQSPQQSSQNSSLSSQQSLQQSSQNSSLSSQQSLQQSSQNSSLSSQQSVQSSQNSSLSSQQSVQSSQKSSQFLSTTSPSPDQPSQSAEVHDETFPVEEILPIKPLVLNASTRSANFLKVREYINENYRQFTWSKPVMQNNCGYDGPDLPMIKEESPISLVGGAEVMNLTPSQAFLGEYFTPQNPIKGMLAYWSVGTGKTCAAISTASKGFEQQGYTILWVTRTTLKSDIWKNMFDQVCSESMKAKIKAGKTIPEGFGDRMRLLPKEWSIRPMSYKQFSNLVEGKNQFYKDLVKINGSEDPLRKTLLIIDEAHKLYGGTDLSSVERPNMDKLHAALMKSYVKSGSDSVKLLLMTATPMTNNPLELVKLVNLTRLPNEQLPDVYDMFAARFLDEKGSFTKKGKFAFLNEIAGHISYLNRERDARQFSQPFVHHVNVPISQPDQEGITGKIADFETEIVSTDSRIKELETELKEGKKTFSTQKKILKERCIGLKKFEKDVCLGEVKEGISLIDSEHSNKVEEKKNELAESKDRKKEVKKQITLMKKALKESISQMTMLDSKCPARVSKKK